MTYTVKQYGPVYTSRGSTYGVVGVIEGLSSADVVQQIHNADKNFRMIVIYDELGRSLSALQFTTGEKND